MNNKEIIAELLNLKIDALAISERAAKLIEKIGDKPVSALTQKQMMLRIQKDRFQKNIIRQREKSIVKKG